MAQLTIELDNETAQRLADTAARAHMRANEWVSALVRARVCGEWPNDVRQLAGVWPDFPDSTELRQSDHVTDIPREASL